MTPTELKALAILVGGRMYNEKIYVPVAVDPNGPCCNGCVGGGPGARICQGLIASRWEECEDIAFKEFKL